MNKELNIFTLRMLRDQYEVEHLDTEVEALEAAISVLETDGDLISRQAVIEAEPKIRPGGDKTYLLGFKACADKWLDNIRNLPSAQPEIIRCKDCKHSEHWYRDKRKCFLWHETGIDVFEDGYCNYAERRTDV